MCKKIFNKFFFGIILLIIGLSFSVADIQNPLAEIGIDMNNQEVLSEKELLSLENFAFVLNANEKYADALEVSNQILAKDHQNWAGLSMKGWALLGLGQTEQALVVLDDSLELNSDNALALSNKAGALYSIGRCKEVLQTLNYADIIDPNSIFNKKLRELAEKCILSEKYVGGIGDLVM